MSRNGYYTSLMEGQKASPYNQRLYGAKGRQIICVHRGMHALNNGLFKHMIDIKTIVLKDVLFPHSV